MNIISILFKLLLFGLLPVSYTHLDVYKRQPLNPTAQNVEIATKNIEAVEEFIYLDSQIHSNNDINTEIRRRIYLANKTYYGLKST